MKFTLTIEMDGSAFEITASDELARILRETAQRVEACDMEGSGNDINGNRVAVWAID